MKNDNKLGSKTRDKVQFSYLIAYVLKHENSIIYIDVLYENELSRDVKIIKICSIHLNVHK